MALFCTILCETFLELLHIVVSPGSAGAGNSLVLKRYFVICEMNVMFFILFFLVKHYCTCRLKETGVYVSCGGLASQWGGGVTPYSVLPGIDSPPVTLSVYIYRQQDEKCVEYKSILGKEWLSIKLNIDSSANLVQGHDEYRNDPMKHREQESIVFHGVKTIGHLQRWTHYGENMNKKVKYALHT